MVYISTTRRRSIPVKVAGSRLTMDRYNRATGAWISQPTNIPSSVPFQPNIKGTQVTVSENHSEWRRRKSRNNTQDIGGDFSTEKTQIVWSNPDNFVSGTVLGTFRDVYKYSGPILATPIDGSFTAFPASISSSNTVLDGWGAKAVAKSKPTNALVDLSTTLGELMGPGGIPRAIGRAAFWHEGVKDALKQSADDFLNVQFSLTPIVQDMVGFANSVMLFSKLVKQYERDAGKVVRRRWSFEPINTESNAVTRTGVYPYTDPTTSGLFGSASGSVIRRRETSIRRWFSGAFTYHLPTGYYSRNKVVGFSSDAQRILGLQPTPETLWNLAPWSWAVDWFTSAGDVVSNVSDWSTDGLVMRYGYLMEHTLSKDTYLWRTTSGNIGCAPSPVVVTRERKLRRRANPFGFGLTWGGLSPRQLAIAAALGISRGLQ